MNPRTTALILLGYQNNYFGQDGFLNQVIKEYSTVNNIIVNTVELIEKLPDSILIISTPINFASDYKELADVVVILKHIKEIGALQVGTKGIELIDSLKPFKDRIVSIHGKQGFNAFVNTNLDSLLRSNNINHVLIAGSITSICIDCTARAAYQLDYQVSILSDCTLARTMFEQEFYCENIFPLYANVVNTQEILNNLLMVSECNEPTIKF